MVILDSLAKGHQKSFNQMVIPDSLAKEHKIYSSPHRTSYSLEKTHVKSPKICSAPRSIDEPMKNRLCQNQGQTPREKRDKSSLPIFPSASIQTLSSIIEFSKKRQLTRKSFDQKQTPRIPVEPKHAS
jgi:hypothetical protein